MTPLRLLIVEDNEDDEILLVRALRMSGFDLRYQRVQTAETLGAALREQTWDLIISDYHMPSFSAPAAFALMKAAGLDLPFIIVSGTVGEEGAVEAMKLGVHDYIVKGNLLRLIPAVEREVREARLRAEQRALRDQLAISERMATAGTLAAGIAHEINNPLSIVLGNLDFVLQAVLSLGPDCGAQLLEPLRDARSAAGRILSIVRDVKVFSRPDQADAGPVDVHRVIESSLRMASNEVRHRAQVVRSYGLVPLVHANEAQLGQVFLNLIVNAAQAIPEGRASTNEIRLTTRLDDADRVVLEISDTGGGVPEPHRERIFDPFFTTKPIGVGTGLGLSICLRLVQTMGGEITLESEPGKPTVFRVAIPAAKEPRERLTVAPASIAPSRRGQVLVVDDELAIGRALQRNLARHHDTTIVTSGKDALALLAEGRRFDALLCDLMMPEMTGMELFEELLRATPDQAARTVFVTGGAFTDGARAFLDRIPNRRLEKPVRLGELFEVIASLVQ